MINYNQIADSSRASIEKEDLRILLPIVAQIEPKNILEIGTWKGYSAETWIKAFNPVQFFTLEKDSANILDYIIPIGRIPELNFWYNTDSHEQKTLDRLKIDILKIDFLFIDGDHSLKGVEQDFKMYSPLVRKGGIIAFHDSCYHADETEEVDLFWKEIKKEYPYVEIRAGKNSTGIGLIWV